MRPFRVPIRTDDPQVVAEALRVAGMKEQAELADGAEDDPEGFTALSVTVVFDAPDAATAERRVREAVGNAGEVGPASRAGDA